MDRNLAFEIIRVTEEAALAGARWMGKGDAVAADEAAIKAMHTMLRAVSFSGRIAQGEGEKNSVAQLYTGEQIGSGDGDRIDLAVDALECTRSVAFGRFNAMAVVALAPADKFMVPATHYLDKLAVGPEAAKLIDMNVSVEENLSRVADAKNYAVSDLTVIALDRARHAELFDTIRKTGARLHLIPDGDVAAAVAVATPGTGIDVLMGTGSAGAGVLSAAAMRCLGGELLARYSSDDGKSKTDDDRVYCAADLVMGDNIMFAATGITDGDLLNGVNYHPGGATTHSLVIRSRSRTRRYITTEHYFEENRSC